MKNNIFLLLLFINVLQKANSQSLRDPVSNTNSIFTYLTSDFGPRNWTSGSIMHRGLDYRLAAYNKAYAVEKGKLTFENVNNFSNARILLHSSSNTRYWRYIHFLNHNSPNNTWDFISSYSPYRCQVIVQRENINGQMKVVKAIADSACNSIVTNYIENGDTVNLDREIEAGEWIYMAHSYANGNHLHIDRGSSARNNPLELILHKDSVQGNYSIIGRCKEIVNNQAQVFSNEIYGTSIILETDVNSTVDKDFDNLTLRLCSGTANHVDLNKTEYTGNNQISSTFVKKLSTVSQIEKAIDEKVYPVFGVVSREFFKYLWNSQSTISSCNRLFNLEYYDKQYIISVPLKSGRF